jgi:hypothetical protein
MEIDQRQKDVCPPGEAGQSGQDEHILLGHGGPPRAVSITLQPTSGGARFNRASNILQRGEHFFSIPCGRPSRRPLSFGVGGFLLFRHPQLQPSPDEFLAFCVPRRPGFGSSAAFCACSSLSRSVGNIAQVPGMIAQAHSSVTRTIMKAIRPRRGQLQQRALYEWTSWGPHGNAAAISETWQQRAKDRNCPFRSML